MSAKINPGNDVTVRSTFTNHAGAQHSKTQPHQVLIKASGVNTALSSLRVGSVQITGAVAHFMKYNLRTLELSRPTHHSSNQTNVAAI